MCGKLKLKLIYPLALLFVFTSCSERLSLDSPRAEVNTIILSRWSPDHVWVPGHYAYKNGDYAWVKGHYAYDPKYRTSWVPAHIRKTPRGKIWIGDRWK